MKVFLFSVVLLCLFQLLGAQRWGKIEKKFTLRRPYTDYLANWRVGGSAKIEDFKIKFQPQLQKQAGYIWSTQPVGMKSWEVILEIGSHGIPPLSTGEGLAFWHTTDPYSSGSVYGFSDRFNGLGIFFDSFDSDDNGEPDPYILAMYNDGKNPIGTDGAGTQLGVCFVGYRNLQFPAKFKISYTPDQGQLSIGVDIENSGKFKSCMSVKNLVLDPEVQYFGLTVSDYGNEFDIYNFLGINTSEDFDPKKQTTKEPETGFTQVEPSNPADSKPAYESHVHFQRVVHRLDSIKDRVASVENQFRQQFEIVFNNHNTALEYHVSRFQGDLEGKHDDTSKRVLATSNLIQAMSETLDSLYVTLERMNPTSNTQSSVVETLTNTKVSCVTDNHRGKTMIEQLKGTADSLQQRQEEILLDVHSNVKSVDSIVQNGCGMTSNTAVLFVLLGVLLGSFFMSYTQKRNKNNGRLPFR
eukprot:c17381_g1_i2.p1 GENE.c17381_g1_i2~~c17381_g1_i2.p1  ORF type:complete len:468 (+),score=178.76 c17381_g1_i2:77-1480(+)